MAINVGALGVTGGQIREAENTNCDDYAVGTTYGTNSLVETQTLINGPPNAQTAVTIYTLPGNRNGSNNYAIQIATCRIGSVMWIRSCDGSNGYGAWVQIATNAPAIEYNLSLASGVTVGGLVPKYSKDTLGWVSVRGTVTLSQAPTSGQILATLPAGYRPADLHPIILYQGTGWTTLAYIASNGEIRLHAGTTPSGYNTSPVLAFSTVFRAVG